MIMYVEECFDQLDGLRMFNYRDCIAWEARVTTPLNFIELAKNLIIVYSN